MVAGGLTREAREENARALMLAAGISGEEAAKRLSAKVLLTAESTDEAAHELVDQLEPVLGRTLGVEREPNPEQDYALEILVGAAEPRSTAARVCVTLRQDGCVIGTRRGKGHSTEPTHPLLATIAACYAAGVAIYRSVGRGIGNPPPNPLILRYADIVPDVRLLMVPIELGEAYLAGAGAIGNGFLWAARHVNLQGLLHIVDDDRVSSGNLQRQVWFTDDDIGSFKCETLAAKAQPFMPACRLKPSTYRLQDHPNRGGQWLKRLIVAVDSRRARRELQNEFPREVFDASTTDVREIVLHHNRQPSEFACLGCLYWRDEKEISQDEIIAEHLGVSVADVRTSRISGEAAIRIAMNHPPIDPQSVEGLAYDSLYKQLCATSRLHTEAGKQVVAPFAFVSVLAGALLLVDLASRTNGANADSNEWRVSPWRTPFAESRILRLRQRNCECCGRSELRKFAEALWSGSATKRG